MTWVTPAEKLRAALRHKRWSQEELAWVLDLSVESAEQLVRKPPITPTVTLRLEAALDIPALEWYSAAGMPMPDLWLIQDRMAGELDAIRGRRRRLGHDPKHEIPPRQRS